ncbi:uncharacterized protein FOMMEDRAFT_157485 [Fomitiporia mediterranea MF3/22]|uniref:uncharacterized protein n=1 Tax=Fomitiporia mediterranea (strain MF3/22) TaxID=694068 RepID=UPI0004408E67|nr:uncharacterized protein FOMMEDRAFT_157485 [Fomitiporia mediterranea MF3/22]EJD02269.1 hypothetical protein FOMMEDRAFT_157485 [Fomitiporia mediterranea MF3/22]
MSLRDALPTNSTPQPAPSFAAPTSLNHIRIEAYFAIAYCSLLLYYWMLRLDKEVKYFWSGQLSTVSVIFYANRCIGVIGAVSHVVFNGFRRQTAVMCTLQFVSATHIVAESNPGHVTFWILILTNWLTIVLLDYILIMRITALYGQKGKVLDVCLKALLFVESSAALGVLVYFTHMEDVHSAKIAEGMTICVLRIFPPRELAIAWALPTLNGFLLLCLTLYKAAEYSRRSAGFRGFDIVRIIAQDQTIYFCCLIVISVLRIASFTVKSHLVAIVLVSASNPASLCILGDQLLINLKEAGSRILGGSISYWNDDVEESTNRLGLFSRLEFHDVTTSLASSFYATDRWSTGIGNQSSRSNHGTLLASSFRYPSMAIVKCRLLTSQLPSLPIPIRILVLLGLIAFGSSWTIFFSFSTAMKSALVESFADRDDTDGIWNEKEPLRGLFQITQDELA